jgi:uncharacterized protein
MAATHAHHREPHPTLSFEHRLAGRGFEAQDALEEILQRYRSVAVVGLSSKLSRPSYGVAAYLKEQGYHVIPVNPNERSVFGDAAYPNLESVPEPIEIVVIFRQAQYVPAIVESAIRRQARVIWMQEGIVHERAAARARAAGLAVVQNRCILKEHARRFLSEGL